MSIVDGLLAPVKVGPTNYEKRAEVPVPFELYEAVAKTLGEFLAPEELAKATVLADEWKAAVDGQNQFGRDKIAAANAEHQRAVAEAQIAGKPLEDAWTKADIETDFQSRRAAMKVAARERSADAAKIFAPAAGKLCAALKEHAATVAVEEFRTYGRYGVSYRPSLLVESLLSASSRLEREADKLLNRSGVLGTDPRSMFRLLNIEL